LTADGASRLKRISANYLAILAFAGFAGAEPVIVPG